MTLIELRQGMVEQLQAQLPGIKVAPHGGRFGSDELKRYGAGGPAVLVAILGVSDLRQLGSTVEAGVTCAALVVTSDRPNLPRDAGALVIVSTLGAFLPGCDFGLDVSGAIAVRGDNLYSGAIDQLGVALWAFSWKQPGVTLTALESDALTAFLQLHVDYSTVAADTIDLSP